MFEAVGLLVDKLSRTQFGNLDVSGLRPGEYRRLNKKEISQLHNLAVTKSKKSMKTILIALVRGYQKWISPLFPPSCRFQPTCSNYMIQAIERLV